MSIAGDDDLIIDIPLDGISIDADAVSGGEIIKEKTPNPTAGGARVSSIAKSAKAPSDDEVTRLKRERDEATRAVAEERARAERLQNEVKQASEGRTKAEETASLREDQAMEAHWRRLQSDKAQLVGALDAAKARAASAERDIIEATEKGDATKLAAAQRELSRAESMSLQFESGIVEADSQIEQTKRAYTDHEAKRQEQREAQKRQQEEEEKQRRHEQQKAPTPDEWIEKATSAVGRDGADWLRTNKQFVTDEKLNRKFLRFADDYADDNGSEALKSQEFIDALNRKFFPDQGGEDDLGAEDDVEVEASPTKKAAPSAPVSRSAPARSPGQSASGKIRLSSAEQAIAKQMYPELDDKSALKRYASNKARAISDGHYNR